MNFYEEIKPSKVVVRLGDIDKEVERARVGRHFELAHIARADDPESVLSYVAVAADVALDLLQELPFNQVATAYQSLYRLNGLHGIFPFIRSQSKPDSLDYEGRDLALMVHMIASNYGWSRDDILNLHPEEAMFYLLEILVDGHERRKFDYTLSTVGIDKQGKKKAFPDHRMTWHKEIVPQGPPLRLDKEVAVRSGLIPDGKTVTIEELIKGE